MNLIVRLSLPRFVQSVLSRVPILISTNICLNFSTNSLDFLQLTQLGNIPKHFSVNSLQLWQITWSSSLMSDPASIAKWIQIRNNSLKLHSRGENPGSGHQGKNLFDYMFQDKFWDGHQPGVLLKSKIGDSYDTVIPLYRCFSADSVKFSAEMRRWSAGLETLERRRRSEMSEISDPTRKFICKIISPRWRIMNIICLYIDWRRSFLTFIWFFSFLLYGNHKAMDLGWISLTLSRDEIILANNERTG